MTLELSIVNVCNGAPWTEPTGQGRRCPMCDRAAVATRNRIEHGGQPWE